MKYKKSGASALFHLCMGMAILIVASLILPQLFILYTLGMLYYLSFLLYSWLFDYIPPSQNPSTNKRPARMLYWAIIFGAASAASKMRIDIIEVSAAFLGASYYFLHQAFLMKIKNQE